MRKYLAIGGGALLVLLGGSYLGTTQTCFDSAAANLASFESEPLIPELAEPEDALTFAMVRDPAGSVFPLLVTGFSDNDVSGVDIRQLGVPNGSSVFDAHALVGREALISAFKQGAGVETYKKTDLLPSGGDHDQHVASGTNFPEHAEETDSTMVFNFPKFGTATPAVTNFPQSTVELLDYEVEICVRFDRDVETVEDFDQAVKAFFLCGDFSNRATLTRLINPENFDSGSGFSDAKSGPGFFPTGPFLVIPNDWRSFVDEERMMTFVNGEARQDARGGEMTLDFRELTDKALADTEPRFVYQKTKHKLLPDDTIAQGATLMSGTSEGVVFTPPTRCDISAGVWAHILGGGFLTGKSERSSVIETFIDREEASRHYLQPGDTVEYSSSRLGTITIDIVE